MKPNPTCNVAPSSFRTLCLAVVAITLPWLAHAQSLTWATQEQAFQTQFGDTDVRTSYAFTNTSEQTIEITKTSATCGCTVPTLEKKIYQPNETGELNAVFTIGSRQGKQRKVITVVTKNEAGEEASYELKLNVDIPVPVTFAPRVRFWKVQQEATTQEIRVSFHKSMPINLESLEPKNKDAPNPFTYEIEAITPGAEYKIKLTPKTPDRQSQASFYLVGAGDTGETLKRYPIYVYVR